MDCFIGNVPPQTSSPQFEKFIRGIFSKLSIKTFECRKDRNKNFAIITFLHATEGELFLLHHGVEDRQHRKQQVLPSGELGYVPRSQTKSKGLRFLSSNLQCRPGRNSPDEYTLKSLTLKEKKSQVVNTLPNGSQSRGFQSPSLLCGTWEYVGESPVFTVHMKSIKPWMVNFGKRFLTISVGKKEHRVQIPYSFIEAVTAESGSHPSMTLTLLYAPLLSEGDSDEILAMKALAISSGGKQDRGKATRVSCIQPDHRPIVSTCLVYRISLPKGISNTGVKHLQRNRDIVDTIFQHTRVLQPRKPHETAFKQLLSTLSRPPYSEGLPFAVRFQIQKLAQNGYLQPTSVLALLPEIAHMVKRSGGEVAASAVRKLFNKIPFAGPETEASVLSNSAIHSLLKKSEEFASGDVLSEALSNKNSDNVVLVYRATVTPTGTYLYGPEPEANNRVLRKYSKNREDFLRVTFADEDGGPVRFNPNVSNDKIFDEHFSKVLREGIQIAGKKYSFLGFSHSSLRAQSCWFMAPFFDVNEGRMLLDRHVIARLGDFSHIRCPAKCAARIGQAFSDSRDVVKVDSGIVKVVKDVVRNGRTFSDGVGTFSPEFLEHMRDSLPYGYGNWPTCFQVRYQGAKGMLSLDSRLRGNALVIRDSMIKFSGSDATDIEICGSSSKPLPMVLNRQLIKILEDCGTQDSFFLNLQCKAVNELRLVTKSAHNAAYFLQSRRIGGSFYLPWFIRKLNALGMSFQEDDFLKNVIEMVVLVELRAIKYRSRIPVPKGHTLYGIMDETGTLEEGEVFVITSTEPGEGKKNVLTGNNIIVSRSPALHPGDVQLVKAIDVPRDHPLRKLSNCICFSQKGERDLPSQLSGGDLDGDLYHIIYDPAAMPTQIFTPADYPRADPVDLGREVEKDDMIDFFVTFMATDQLGRIAVLHQIIADQDESGTLSPGCLKLADMHSTAVDYSKTGIPVKIEELPRAKRYRPDFMAPGPHVLISKDKISFTTLLDEEDGDEEVDFREYQYYESVRILGKLYRDIDEKEIFSDVQQKSGPSGLKKNFIDEVWVYATNQCRSVRWTQHIDWAQDVRDMYEYNVLEIMSEYAPNHRYPLSELEVFIGQIIGKTADQGKRHRELSTTLKERFDESVAYVVDLMIRDDGEIAQDSLERAMACLHVALGPGVSTKYNKPLLSFKYIAAAVCLKEVEKTMQSLA